MKNKNLDLSQIVQHEQTTEENPNYKKGRKEKREKTNSMDLKLKEGTAIHFDVRCVRTSAAWHDFSLF